MENYIFERDEFLQAAELYTRLNVPKSTWDKKRKQILEHLKLYCYFEIIGKGRYTIYHIIEQFGEYQPYNGRRSKEENKKVYSEVIAERIQAWPEGTYKSINNDIIHEEKIKELHHAESTSYGYVIEVTKEDYGSKAGDTGKRGSCEGKVWCYKPDGKHDELLPEDILNEWKMILRKCFNGNEEEEFEIICDWKNHVISYQQMKDALSDVKIMSYNQAEEIFMAKYGYIPSKVNKYKLFKERV